jgi:hypothetical protein
MRKLFFMLVCSFVGLSAYAQKKPLDHSVYDSWKSLNAISVPRNGDILMYNINPQEGDTELVIENIRTGQKTVVPRATRASLSQDGSKVVAVIKPLNLLLLGEQYARTMGLDVQRTRLRVFLSTTLLAGTVTAFCGPVGFIGLAVPHLARMLSRAADHRILIPATALTGSVVLLFCDIISKWLTLPINTVTALMGIPIVVWVVLRHKTIA